MSLRSPSGYSSNSPAESGLNVLDYEIAQEKAASLGRAGAAVREAMDRLHGLSDAADRVALLKSAAEAVYAYFIQRELCGLRRHDDAIREYGIPARSAGAAGGEVVFLEIRG